MTTAFTGVGCELRRGVPPTGTPLAEVRSISGPTMTKDFVDATSLGTANQGYREFLAGFQDAGEVTATLNWTFNAYDTLLNDFEASVEQQYQIVLADGATPAASTQIEFSGLVTALPIDISADAPVSFDVTIKLSGAIVVN